MPVDLRGREVDNVGRRLDQRGIPIGFGMNGGIFNLLHPDGVVKQTFIPRGDQNRIEGNIYRGHDNYYPIAVIRERNERLRQERAAIVDAENPFLVRHFAVREANAIPQRPVDNDEVFDPLDFLEPERPIGIDNDAQAIPVEPIVRRRGGGPIHQAVDPEVGIIERMRRAQEAVNAHINNQFIGEGAVAYKIKTNSYNNKSAFKEEDLMYRTILINKRRVMHVKCPKIFKGTDEDIVKLVDEGRDGFYYLDYIPNKKLQFLSKKVALKLKNKKPKVVKKKVKASPISDEEFYTKISKHLTLPNKLIPELNVTQNKFQLNVNVDRGNCLANVYGIFNDEYGIIYRGISTGVFIANDSTVEVIGIEISNDDRYSNFNCSFTDRINPRKFYVKYNRFYPLVNYDDSKNCTREYDFVKVRIKDAKASANAFGFVNIKNKMVGKDFNPSEFRIKKNLDSVKLNKRVDTIDIKTESGTFVKFLISDVEFLYIDPSKYSTQAVQAKKILQKGSIARIIDDRRLELKRNDIVKVVNIVYDKNSYKRTLLTVLDDKGKAHKVFLKQIKLK